MSLRDDILDRLDIVDLVSRYVNIKKVGKNRSGLCPFHNERSPSFTVAEDKQIFKCFGCGKGGNAITFHMEMERIDFRDSIKLLAQETGVDITQYQKDPEKQQAKASAKEKLKLLNKRTQGLFKQYFEGSDAQRYVHEKRGLSDVTIEKFGLGYAPNSYDITMQFLREKGFSDSDLIDAGLAKKGKKAEAFAFFRHRLTFPIHDHIGNIVGFGGRALTSDQTPKYLNTTETELYQKSKILYGLDKAKNALKEFGGLMIVEGYMDVIALSQYGLPIGIATCGTALTVQHTKLIKRHTDHLIFAFDHDGAGFEATVRGLKVAYEQDLFPKILIFPDAYKDVDERLVQNGDTRNETGEIDWNNILKTSTKDGFDRALEQYQHRTNLENPVERKKVMQSFFEMLSKIEDYAIMQLYFTKLVDFFGLSEQMLRKQFRAWIKKASARKRPGYVDPSTQEKSPDSSSKIAEKYLLGSLVVALGFSSTLSRNHSSAAYIGTQNEGPFVGYARLLALLASYFPGSVLGEVVSNTLKEETKEHLIGAQMRREMQLEGLDTQKTIDVIKTFLHQQVYKLQRVVIKSTKLTGEQKEEVLKLVREV